MIGRLDVTVIGAGIVGVCCALSLQRAGASVTMLDPRLPGEQDSFGNAGVIGTSYILPSASPAILRRLPSMLMDPSHPMVLRLRAVPGLARWFRQFVRACRHVTENTAAAAALQRGIRHDWDDLLRETRADDLVDWSGMLEVCETNTTLDTARYAWRTMRDFGFRVEELGPDEVCELEPAVSPAVTGGALLRDCGYTVDPLALTRRLHECFLSAGGRFIRDRVRSINTPDASALQVRGEAADYSTHAVVIAAGVRSPSLAAPFGNGVAVVAERGYHIMFNEPGVTLRRPLTALDRKVVMTPMAAGLRMTTMAEFTTPDAPPDHRRAERVFRRALPLLPDLSGDIATRWVGSRASTPDSLPVVRRSPGHPHVFYAFGHGGRGLTLAATTARLITSAAMRQDVGRLAAMR